MSTLTRFQFVVPAAAFAILLQGCEATRSDSQNFSRQREAERRQAVAGMKEATAQAPAGSPLSGNEMTAAIAGKTHVFVYGSSPSGKRGRYVEYEYFAPGGHFVWTNSEWATDRAGNPADRWRIDGPRLCITNNFYSSDEKCYTLSVLPDGRVQYFIARPGDPTDGLLTKVTDAVVGGQAQ